jgi:hypothetical protein
MFWKNIIFFQNILPFTLAGFDLTNHNSESEEILSGLVKIFQKYFLASIVMSYYINHTNDEDEVTPHGLTAMLSLKNVTPRRDLNPDHLFLRRLR